MIGKESIADEVVKYLKKNLKKGYTKDSLIVALTSQGYSKILIEKAMKKTEEELANEAPVLKTKPEIKYEVVEPKQESKKGFWKRLFG